MLRFLMVIAVACGVVLSAMAAEWRFEVAVEAPRVVSCPVDAKWSERMATHELVAVGKGGTETVVPWVLDTSGRRPELVWFADGRTRFKLRKRRGGQGLPALPKTDLVSKEGDTISIGNSFFSLQHPMTGKGGFPEKIRFEKSGAADDGLYFMDQFVRKNASGGVDVKPVRNDGHSSARIVFNSPLRAVVEVKAKVADVEAVYRYIYSAWSPLVRVELQCRQDAGKACAEAWTVGMGWPRDAPRYSASLTKAGDAPTPFQEKGKPSRAFSDHWLAVTDGTNAVGVASIFGAVGWDASSSFVYYLLAQRDGWKTTALSRSALLYFGPLQSRDGFDRSFAGVRPQVKVFRNNGRARSPNAPCGGLGEAALPGEYQWVLTEPMNIPSDAVLLEGRGIRLAFDSAERGFNCIGIENKVNPDPEAFCGSEPGRAGFWSLTFWKDGSPTNTITIDNLAPCERKVERRGDALVFDWRGLSLGDEKGVVDVQATVTLTQNSTAAEWWLAVKNRSKRWGLAETTYPILRNVVRPREADVLVPKGNWGGRLVKSYQAGGGPIRYPSSMGAQVQMSAFMLGGTGLQVTALDGKGQEKVFDMAGLDLGIRYRCPDEGVPGAANAPDFAVETASFAGDWWTAAKRYRVWATKQKWAAKGPIAARTDFNRQLGNVGYWIKSDWRNSAPEQVSNFMVRAMAELPGIPLGLHWYCWHKGPFDHYYPELFPERAGMKETVAWLRGNGVLVMPYINGRLWDNGLASYSNAVPFACKKPDGAVRLEDYGSGRKFAPMCPMMKPWQQTLDALCDRLENEIGVNAIYLDQISASTPAPCHDRTHGHPLGGGSHWMDGYRELMKPIREKAVMRGVALTSENAAEPYMDSFDAHLTWFGHAFDDVPVLPAVYSGYTVYFSSNESEKDSLDSYCVQQGQDFLWGCQLGWNDTWVLDDAHKEHLAFTLRLCRERIAHREFFLEGELMGEIPMPPDLPKVEVRWKRRGNYCDGMRFRMPAVRGALWRDRNGRKCVFLVNISDDAQTFTYCYGAMRKTVSISPRSVISELQAFCNEPSTSTPKSSAFVARARELYATVGVEPYTNTVVRQWNWKETDSNDVPLARFAECHTSNDVGWVNIPYMRNVRDIGGWNGLRTGRAYRGSMLYKCEGEPNGVSSATVIALREAGFVTDLDLRGDFEIANMPEATLLKYAGLREARVRMVAYMKSFGGAWREMREALLVFTCPENYPVYFHCKAGADRTGTLAFVLEGLCGVSETDLAIDYELTTCCGKFGSRTRNADWMCETPNRDCFWRMMEAVKSYNGKTLAEKFANCAKHLWHLTDADIAAIRRELVKSGNG